MISHLAQQTGIVLPQLPVPGAAQLPQQAPPPFTRVGTPYYNTIALLGTTAPPARVVPSLSPVTGLGMTSLLAPSVAEPVSASVAQLRRPDVPLPVATLVLETPPTQTMTIASLDTPATS